MISQFSCAAWFLSGTMAAVGCADGVTLSFVESAPRDRFVVKNTLTTGTITGVKIDLRASAGRLIFDTRPAGSGVEVFQPFRAEKGVQEMDVADGATQISVVLTGLTGGQTTGFSIDVDDQLPQSELGQIRVAGGEIKGAEVRFAMADGAVFGDTNAAIACAAGG